MTRALIADPELPVKARSGRGGEIVRCIACQACIAHYHAAEGILCAINPQTGRERSWTRVSVAPRGRGWSSSAPGPAGLTAAAEGLEAGFDVVVLERRRSVGGQLALVLDAPGARDDRSRLSRQPRLDARARRPSTRGGRLRGDGCRARADRRRGRDRSATVRSSGSRRRDAGVSRRGTCSSRPSVSGRVVVVDWGGDQAGLDAAEVLVAAGCDRDARHVVGGGRRELSPVPAQSLPPASVPGRCGHPAAPGARRRRPGGRQASERVRPRGRGVRSKPMRSCSPSGASRKTRSRRRCVRPGCVSRRPATVSRRVGSRKRCSRARSPSAA